MVGMLASSQAMHGVVHWCAMAGLRSVCRWCREPEDQFDMDTPRHCQLLPRAREADSFFEGYPASQRFEEVEHDADCDQAGR